MGLSPGAFWALSREEYDAFVEVFERPIRRWAIQQAHMLNAAGVDKGGWKAEDFLGKGKRNQKGNQLQAMKDQMDVVKANARMMKMRKGEVPDNLPAWAKPRPGDSTWKN